MPGPELILGDDYDDFGQYEILGQDYEILGADDDDAAAMSELFEGDDFGARRRARRTGRSRASLARGLRAARQTGGVLVTSKSPRREYTQALPVESLNIGIGVTATITLNPQRPFRAEEFRVSSTHTAPFFVINSYSIGQDNQFVGPGAIPCDLFSEVARGNIIRGYTANLGNLVTIVVQNISAAQRDFRGAFFGTSLGQP